MQHYSEPTAPWSISRKIFFRYCSSYFLLYVLSSLGLLSFIWNTPVTWAGKWLISRDFKITVWPNGSGDTTYNYLAVFCTLLLAALMTVIWSVADRKRNNYTRLQYWLMVVLRYSLALTMISYGMAKIGKTQFAFPSLIKLEDTFGNTSPMGLAWSYMGYSTGYNLFTGIAEVIGGVFLFFRRTTLFAALWSMTVMLNVVAMNICYDIPVKLFSMHLFLIALYIALPDLQRLIQFFFTQSPVAPALHWYPVFQTRWKRITLVSLKYLLISAFLTQTVYFGISMSRKMNPDIKQVPLYGIYAINRVNVDSTGLLNEHITPFQLSQKIYIEKNNAFILRNGDKQFFFYHSKTDTIQKLLSCWDKKNDTIRLHYQRAGLDTLLLNGMVGKDSIHLLLKRKDPNDYLLVNRGFHWINEYPMNQ